MTPSEIKSLPDYEFLKIPLGLYQNSQSAISGRLPNQL